MEIFDFPEVTKILQDAVGMPEARAKNWTLGRPIKIGGSIRTGSRTLFTRDDIHRLALAYELRKVGMAVGPIASIVNSLRKPLIRIAWLTLSRNFEGGAFNIAEGKKERSERIWTTINVKAMVSLLEPSIEAQLEERSEPK